MNPPTKINAMKAALDILQPLLNCPDFVMMAFTYHAGIDRSRVQRQINRIQAALNKGE